MHPHDAQTPLRATTCFTVSHLGSSDVRQSCEVDGEVEDSALGSDSLLDVLRFAIGDQIEVRVDVGEERLRVELRVEHDFVCDQKNIVLLERRLDRLPIACGWWDDPARAQHRLVDGGAPTRRRSPGDPRARRRPGGPAAR